MLQLEQSFRFDLSHSLARDAEVAADLIERVLAPRMAEPKSHLQYLLFARREVLESFADRFTQVGVYQIGAEPGNRFVLDQLTKANLFIRPDRRLQRNRFLHYLEHLSHSRLRHIEFSRYVLGGGRASQFLLQLSAGLHL